MQQLDVFDILDTLTDIQTIESQIYALKKHDTICTESIFVSRNKFYELSTEYLHIPFVSANDLLVYINKFL